jgi:membrane-bound serine protease (ClpP class)
MKFVSFVASVVLAGFVFSTAAWAESASPSEVADPCVLEVRIEEAIGAATFDYVGRSLRRADELGCGSILMLLNTPGGNLQTTRMIVEKIINSKIPFLCLVHPSGGHAGSAGAIILQACHVAGAMPSTNLGAATPVSGGGEQIPEDMRKKILNDTVSWMDGITGRRGRNQKFGRDIITEAKAVTADEALRLGAIDSVPQNIDEFLRFAQGREVRLFEETTGRVRAGSRVNYEPDVRHKILSWITDPSFAYLLLMLGVALLYYELTHIGSIAPGVLGGICLVIAMVSLHKLDVQWGGLALILLGAAFMLAEVFVPSFGALGVGGIASFVLGSLFLFPEDSGHRIPLALILSTVGVFGGMMLVVGMMAAKTFAMKKSPDVRGWHGQKGRVITLNESNHRKGQIEISGEIWSFVSSQDLSVGDEVTVTGQDHLTLKVKSVDVRLSKENV